MSFPSEVRSSASAVWRRDQGEAWGNEPLWAVQRPHKSRLELEQEAWRRAVRPSAPLPCPCCVFGRFAKPGTVQVGDGGRRRLASMQLL